MNRLYNLNYGLKMIVTSFIGLVQFQQPASPLNPPRAFDKCGCQIAIRYRKDPLGAEALNQPF